MNDFDAACRRMVKAEPLTFLRWLFADFDAVARHDGWVDTRRLPFPGKTDQTGDLVFRLAITREVQPPWALALEFQLEPDPDMFGRMLVYLGTLWMERHPDPEPGSRYQLASSVVNLTGSSRSLPASASFVWPGNDKVQCVLAVRERFLSEEAAKDTLEAVAAGRYDRAILPWVPLMAGGSQPEAVAQWLELASAEPDDRKRATLGSEALVFAEKSTDLGAWERALEGWGMVKSIWMEKNRQEGRAEGRAEAQQANLLRLLQVRTKQEVPADLADKIRATAEQAQLEQWFDAAATSETLDAFRRQTGL